jgi:hypothetical protein
VRLDVPPIHYVTIPLDDDACTILVAGCSGLPYWQSYGSPYGFDMQNPGSTRWVRLFTLV